MTLHRYHVVRWRHGGYHEHDALPERGQAIEVCRMLRAQGIDARVLYRGEVVWPRQ